MSSRAIYIGNIVGYGLGIGIHTVGVGYIFRAKDEALFNDFDKRKALAVNDSKRMVTLLRLEYQHNQNHANEIRKMQGIGFYAATIPFIAVPKLSKLMEHKCGWVATYVSIFSLGIIASEVSGDRKRRKFLLDEDEYVAQSGYKNSLLRELKSKRTPNARFFFAPTNEERIKNLS